MNRMIRSAIGLLMLAGTAFGVTGTAQAQSPFSPAVIVNDGAITYYEIDQRAKLLRILTGSVNPLEQAREQLVEDRLKLQAAFLIGLTPTENAIKAAMEDFAKRGNMTAEQLIPALKAEGIDEESFRDFVLTGIAWRGVIQTRFGGRAQISEDEIDRAMASGNGQGGIQVLLSEVIIPVTPQTEDQVLAVANQIRNLKTEEEFAQAALQYSASPSRQNGGKLDWMPMTEVPGPLRPLILSLSIGEVSEPLPLQGAVGLFRLRSIAESTPGTTPIAEIDYAMLYFPGGRTEANLKRLDSIQNRIDRCDDLYKYNFGQPQELLIREAQAPSKIPGNIRSELSKLDPGETSTALSSKDGQTLILLMHCGQTAEIGLDLSREDVALALRNQRLESFANGYLAQLMAEATIEYR
ncbi:peptidylprolyl isomerase [Shimia biformata]|uniref:peptidylprolyl isomerase n=1 Tax=Shimia biformata TaxID=1294299 RepID=UPI00194F465C|nr:peptidylprolyl isomerase [Shimia biformata]